MNCDEFTDPSARDMCLAAISLLGRFEESQELTPEMRDKIESMFGHNIDTYGVRVSHDGIYFTDKNTYKNWLYYAGFEYVDDECINILDVDRDFIAEFDRYCSERVDRVVEELLER